jgi:4-hydroxy-tetrahydrodipicolinate reductase
MLKILLCGALGKMGAAVKNSVAGSDDCTIAGEVDVRFSENEGFSSFERVEGQYDCIIDFSHPSVTDSMLKYALKTKTPIVLCTTGLSEEQTEAVKKAGEEIPVFFSANMSLGVNLMLALCKKATQILGADFDIEIIEAHHHNKVDAPSGTAKMLLKSVVDSTGFTPVYGRDGYQPRKPNEVGVHAVRGGSIVGDHDVIFAGTGEVIELTHKAISRDVFAIGALKACEYMATVTDAGLYNMDDVLGL